jgi:uncharacterized protein (DUF4415 family)
MREEYDFSASEPNPYCGRVRQRKAMTMNVDVRVIDYFKAESERTGVPYQSIINAYLLQCVEEEKHLKLA